MRRIKNPLSQACSYKQYLKIKEAPLTASIFIDNFGEGATSVFFIPKTEIQEIEEALLSLLLIPIMRHGDYLITEETEEEILALNLLILRKDFVDDFEEVDRSILVELMERIRPKMVKNAHKNFDWNTTTNDQELMNLIDFRTPGVVVYQMKYEWNHEDYFIQTEKYFVRWLWSTAA